MKEYSNKKENQFIRRELNRMQDFEYEFGTQDIKDLTEVEQRMLKQYGIGELNISFLEYYERLTSNG